MEDMYIALVNYKSEKDSVNLQKKIVKLDKYISFCKENNIFKHDKKILEGYENWSKISKWLLMGIYNEDISPEVLKTTENPTNLPESIGLILYHIFSTRNMLKNVDKMSLEEQDLFFEAYIHRKKKIMDEINEFDFNPYWVKIMKVLLELDSSFVASKIYPEAFWMSFLNNLDSNDMRNYLCKKIKEENLILIKYFDKDFLEKSKKILTQKIEVSHVPLFK